MNAFTKTARGLSNALSAIAKPQYVKVMRQDSWLYDVLVIPAGQKVGDYYNVGRDQLDALKSGMTPASLGLVPSDYDPDDDDYVCSRYDLAASRADRNNDMKREGV